MVVVCKIPRRVLEITKPDSKSFVRDMEEFNALTEAMADPGVSTFKSGCPEQRRDDVNATDPTSHAHARADPVARPML